MGNEAPIPGFPRPVPELSGKEGGWGQGMTKHWGFFGDGAGLKIGVFWGFIPENPQNKFGDILGTGLSSILGIFGVSSPINPKIEEWGRG